ncbi:unnamed protein product [Prorocentrum cordatum]|uniref:Uncharacterized protein n=1 Tax=Prorocentrum cordatum TaxID=2364126 RepID=A0ABN9W887_9DINO|nr:unnamed protein product [Polarella glacialis]
MQSPWSAMMLRSSWAGLLFGFLASLLRLGVGLGIWRVRGAGPDGPSPQPAKMGLPMNVASIVLLVGTCMLHAGWEAANYMFRPLPLLYRLGSAGHLVNSLLTCSLACALASAADSIGVELENLVVGDCDAANFKERVHHPMVNFLDRNNKYLAKLGLPLVLISFSLVDMRSGGSYMPSCCFPAAPPRQPFS